MTRKADWIDRAWCARMPDLPWRTDAATLPRLLVDQMAAICGACPVREECAAYVEEHDISGGFWAGHDRAQPDVWVDDPLPGLDDGHELGGDAA